MALFKDFNLLKIRESLKSYEQWKPFPKASDRQAWEGFLKEDLQKKRYDELVTLIKALPENPYPVLPCALYMEYRRNGNRTNYETPYFQRRQNFALFVLAECFEGKGVYIDKIIEGFWQILSEITWVIPAHARSGGSRPTWLDDAQDPLPTDTLENVDLFNAETAMALAEALYLLEDQLMAVSPNLVLRVRNELERRVLKTIEQYQDGFWWWGGRNNWSVWCSFNILGTAFYVIKDLDRLARLTNDLMGVVDRFYDLYSDDGACDEGPMYWGVSAGMLFLFLDLLESRIDNVAKIYQDPKLINMTKYLCDVQLHKNNFANFSDSNAKMGCLTPALYIAGLKTNNRTICNLAWKNHFEWSDTSMPAFLTRNRCGGDVNFMLRDILHVKAPKGDATVQHEKSCWYPKLEIGVMRESIDSAKGLIFYCKGGSNFENHNHNDVGQFCLLKNGEQIFIDIGRETYVKDTFNENRYTLWNIRGSGHNIPLLNGCEQLNGRERRTRDVSFVNAENKATIKMDIALTYDEKSQIKEYNRRLQFNFNSPSSLEISDEFLFRSETNVIEHPIYCAQEVILLESGKLKIGTGDSATIFAYDAKQFTVELSSIAINDPCTKSSWGDKIYKIFLKGNFGKSGTFKFKIS